MHRIHNCLLANFFDRNLFALELMQVVETHFFPVTAVAYEPQIGEWMFRGANFVFHFGKQIMEIYENLAIDPSPVLRHDKDTGYIVVEEWSLFLGKISNQVTAGVVHFCHNIEQKGFHIII